MSVAIRRRGRRSSDREWRRANMSGRVEGKVALVTGGASGLGEAIVRRLAEEGASVVLSDLAGGRGAEVAAAVGGLFVPQDVTEEARWDEVVAEVGEQFGRLDILVNNAGIAGPFDAANPENFRLEDWRAVQRVNVEGVILGCRAAIPLMTRSGGGSIVNISSVAGTAPTPGWIAYGASKATVRHLTRSIAVHCARSRSRIRCNSVHPGEVKTSMYLTIVAELARQRGTTAEELMEETRTKHIPQGEFQEPEDIANAVLFLASDEARRITGVALTVDGGETA
jgi:NAD(P)-dependent dehydrogenase (short-subunit alcohol dehydrogenase family)